MKTARMTPTSKRLLLAVALLAVAPAWALDDDQVVPGAQAAALRTQASELEARIEQECLKLAPPARPVCRKQLAQVVARLREQALRAN